MHVHVMCGRARLSVLRLRTAVEPKPPLCSSCSWTPRTMSSAGMPAYPPRSLRTRRFRSQVWRTRHVAVLQRDRCHANINMLSCDLDYPFELTLEVPDMFVRFHTTEDMPEWLSPCNTTGIRTEGMQPGGCTSRAVSYTRSGAHFSHGMHEHYA